MKALNEQSIIDLAIQTAGSVEAAFDLAKKNGLSLTDELTAGQELAAVDVVSKPVASYFNQKEIKPATRPIKFQRPDARFWFDEMPIEFE